jgi:acyl CoA:acetate/3-ketoacid CoA transferase beta subunit
MSRISRGDICESFAMIRRGHVDATIIGAFQVNESGDFASWLNPSRGLNGVGNIGGSMDLAASAKKLHIAMEHTTNEGMPCNSEKKSRYDLYRFGCDQSRSAGPDAEGNLPRPYSGGCPVHCGTAASRGARFERD